MSIQAQIREMLVSAILSGQLAEGSALPSCRKMAKLLKVSRNTVVLAYQGLVDDNYLVSKERSGFYVAEDVLGARVQSGEASGPARSTAVNGNPAHPDWNARFTIRPSQQETIVKPKNWPSYPYPFVYGQADPSLFPISAWRECTRQSLGRREIASWTSDPQSGDDPLLLDQIRTRLLPRRGIHATKDEILVTMGAQNAVFLAASMLIKPSDVVGIEDPCYPDARNIFQLRTPRVRPIPVDEEGIPVDERLDDCDYIYVTPSHQFPTTVTMPLERRNALLRRAAERDFVIIEDDYEYEANYVAEPTPALKSLDRDGRVIYAGSLSKSLFPGLRLGYVVGPSGLIEEMRALRRLVYRHVPTNNQLTTGLFLSLGHHDALVNRLQRVYRERWAAMRDALDRYLPGMSSAPSFGGTSYWVTGPAGLDADLLADRLLGKGVVIERGPVHFSGPNPPRNNFRLGFSSIGVEKIEKGISIIAEEIDRLTSVNVSSDETINRRESDIL